MILQNWYIWLNLAFVKVPFLKMPIVSNNDIRLEEAELIFFLDKQTCRDITPPKRNNEAIILARTIL